MQQGWANLSLTLILLFIAKRLLPRKFLNLGATIPYLNQAGRHRFKIDIA